MQILPGDLMAAFRAAAYRLKRHYVQHLSEMRDQHEAKTKHRLSLQQMHNSVLKIR